MKDERSSLRRSFSDFSTFTSIFALRAFDFFSAFRIHNSAFRPRPSRFRKVVLVTIAEVTLIWGGVAMARGLLVLACFLGG